MRAVTILIVACGMGLIIALIGHSIGAGKTAAQLQETYSGAMASYLSKRFDSAYSTEIPQIALWEGTNLIAFLEQGGQKTGRPSPEDRAERIFLHARISALFSETGDSADANEHATRALEWYQSITSNQTETASEVVQRALNHARVKRERQGISPRP